MRNDGGFSEWKPSEAAAARGKNDGEFAIFKAGPANGKNDGGFSVYEPDASKRPAAEPPSRPASSPTSSAPLASPILVRSLSVAPGAKDLLRSQLVTAINAASIFLLQFFESAVTEIGGAPAAERLQKPKAASEGYEAFGFRLEEQDGELFVSAIFGGSPAEAAGLQVGDQIHSVDDGIRTRTITQFVEAWPRGQKWGAYELQVRRANVGKLPVTIRPAQPAG